MDKSSENSSIIAFHGGDTHLYVRGVPIENSTSIFSTAEFTIGTQSVTRSQVFLNAPESWVYVSSSSSQEPVVSTQFGYGSGCGRTSHKPQPKVLTKVMPHAQSPKLDKGTVVISTQKYKFTLQCHSINSLMRLDMCVQISWISMQDY